MNKLPAYDGTQACLDAPAEAAAAFAGRAGAQPEPAKDLCRQCPFRRPCRTFALFEDVEGVWGGTDSVDRRQLRNERGLPEPRRVSDDLDDLVLVWRTGRPAAVAAA